MRRSVHRPGTVEDQHRWLSFHRAQGEPPFRHLRIAREVGVDLFAPFKLEAITAKQKVF